MTEADWKCSSSRQIRVYALQVVHMLPLLRGELRIRNLPADAQVVAALPIGDRIGVRVHSATFQPVERGLPIPTVTAVVERMRSAQ